MSEAGHDRANHSAKNDENSAPENRAFQRCRSEVDRAKRQALAAPNELPLWLIVLVVLRAGIVEELFYRGYAIERLQSLGLNRYWAGAIPLLIFSFAHETNGWANVVLALSLGIVLTIVYLWRRDLLANMIGHFLIDFISVVLPRLLAHTS